MKNIFKSLTVLCLVLCLGLLLVACGGNKNGGNGKGDGKDEHDCYEDGHVFADEPEYIYTQPTCNNPGEARVRCTMCDEADVIEIEPLGHNKVVVEEAIEPTCTTVGWTARIKCDREGCWETIQVPEVIAMKEHEVELVQVLAPEYDYPGAIGVGCKNCEGAIQYTDIPSIEEGDYTFVRNEGENKIFSGTVEGYDIEFAVSNFVVEYRTVSGMGVFLVTEYKGNSTDIVIPETVADRDVYGIADSAFKNNTDIVSVTFPDDIYYVANGAFAGCTSLERVENYSYGRYPERVFENCTSLTTLSLGENVIAINDYAFAGCTALESVTWTGSDTYSMTIGERAFMNCSSLETVTLPGSLSIDGRGVFEGCESIEELYLPYASGAYYAYINFLGDLFTYDFVGSSAVNANVPASLKKVTLHIELNVMNAAWLESVTIMGEEHWTELQEGYFAGCTSLREIVLPDNIKDIGAGAFEGCTSLTFTEKDNGVYFGTILVGLTDAAKNGGISEFVVADGTTVISPDFFNDLVLDKITVPASVKSFSGIRVVESIGAFYYAGTMADWFNVEIYEYYDCPLYYATEFYMLNDSGVYETLGDTLVIPESADMLPYNHFFGWNYTTLVIHDGVGVLCATLPETLERVYYGGTIEQWVNVHYTGYYAQPLNRTPNFYVPDGNGGWELLKVIVIPEGTKNVYREQFKNFANVETVVIPSSVQFINQYAFSGCTGIVNVFYEGTASEWQSLSSQNEFYDFGSANIYYYTENVNTVFAGLSSGALYWHYDENGNPVSWSAGTVDGKTYNYSSTEITVSDNYWMLLQYADSEGVLEEFMKETQLEMYRSSSTKEEFAEKIRAFAAETAAGLQLTFANGEITLTQNGDSTVLGKYIEINGEIHVKIGYQVSVFCYVDAENDQVYEYNAVEENGVLYTATKHIYTLANS